MREKAGGRGAEKWGTSFTNPSGLLWTSGLVALICAEVLLSMRTLDSVANVLSGCLGILAFMVQPEFRGSVWLCGIHEEHLDAWSKFDVWEEKVGGCVYAS